MTITWYSLGLVCLTIAIALQFGLTPAFILLGAGCMLAALLSALQEGKI